MYRYVEALGNNNNNEKEKKKKTRKRKKKLAPLDQTIPESHLVVLARVNRFLLLFKLVQAVFSFTLKVS